MAGGALREILAAFSIDVENAQLIQAEKNIQSLSGKLKAVGSLMAEVFVAKHLVSWVEQTIDAAHNTATLANRLGLGTTELQKFQFAASLSGVEAENAARAFGFLNKNLGAAFQGAGQAKDFAQLGVSIKDAVGNARPAGDIMNDVADALQRLPNQFDRAYYSMKLFGRSGQQLLPVLSQGSEGLRRLGIEFDELGGGMSEEFIELAKQTENQFKSLKLGITSLRTRAVMAMLPAIDAMIAHVKPWIKSAINWADKTNILKTGMIFLSALIGGKVILTLVKLARVFGIMTKLTEIWRRGLLAFSAPLLIIGALYLAFDELYTLMNGGDTILGDLLEKFGGLEGKQKFVDDLKTAWADLKAVYDSFDPETKSTLWLNTLREVSGVVVGLAVSFKTLFDIVEVGSELTTKFFQGWRAQGKVEGFDALEHDKEALVEALKLFTGAGNHAAVETVPQAQDYRPRKPRALPKPGEPGYGVVAPPNDFEGFDVPGPQILLSKPDGPTSMNTITNKNTINVTVTAGKNPEETGKRVAQSAASELEMQNYNTSVALGAT